MYFIQFTKELLRKRRVDYWWVVFIYVVVYCSKDYKDLTLVVFPTISAPGPSQFTFEIVIESMFNYVQNKRIKVNVIGSLLDYVKSKRMWLNPCSVISKNMKKKKTYGERICHSDQHSGRTIFSMYVEANNTLE